MSALPHTLDSLVERGLTLQAVSCLVGCSYVTLYRARKGCLVNRSTEARLEALRQFCIDEETVGLLTRIAKTFPSERIWKVGLAQIIEENRNEPA